MFPNKKDLEKAARQAKEGIVRRSVALIVEKAKKREAKS